MTYYETNIQPMVKGAQTFNAGNEGTWAQYDIKALNAQQVNTVFNYFRSKYREVYPRIQRLNDLFIGDIQVKIGE